MGEIEKIKNLFWEYEWDSVKKRIDSVFVIAKVLEMGTPEQCKILEKIIGREKIKKFLAEKGKKLLSPVSYNFWKNYYEKKTPSRT